MMTQHSKPRLTSRAGVGFGLFLAIGGVFLLAARRRRLRRVIALACWRVLLRGFALRVEVHGTPLPEAGNKAMRKCHAARATNVPTTRIATIVYMAPALASVELLKVRFH